jgi:hypothetical protein
MKKKLMDLQATLALLNSMPTTSFSGELRKIATRVEQDIDAYKDLLGRDQAEADVRIAFADSAFPGPEPNVEPAAIAYESDHYVTDRV